MRLLHIVSGSLLILALNFALAGVGAVKKEDVPKYLAMLNAKSAADRAVAAEMLGKRGKINRKDVEGAVTPLLKLVAKDADVVVRRKSAVALGDIGSDPMNAVPVLIEVLKKDASMDVKLAAAAALGIYGKDATDALPALREFGKNFTDKKDKARKATVTSAIANISGNTKKKS
jgi:HEAT repeat protein